MIRTQIQLEARQERAIKKISRRDGVSMAEVIRRFVNAALEEKVEAEIKGRYARAQGLVGAFSHADEAADVAKNHDAYLDAAFE
jgi:hypothetical protein